MKLLFLGEQDPEGYGDTKDYAFLNWRFDKDVGANKDPMLIAQDHFNMGKGYFGNALVTLFSITKNNNAFSAADILIFPILYNIWQGVELWLKSCNYSIVNLLKTEPTTKRPNHEIKDYYNNIRQNLVNEGLNYIVDNGLNHTAHFINETIRVGAKCDFARYSVQKNSNSQFYNASYGSEEAWQSPPMDNLIGTVPNTRVNISTAYKLTLDIYRSLGNLTEFLLYVYEHDGDLTNAAFEEWLRIDNKYSESYIVNEMKDIFQLIV